MASTSSTSKRKQEARLKPLEEVKAEIEPVLKQQKAAAEAQSEANTVQALARTGGNGQGGRGQRISRVTTTDLITQG